jgi:hypothetical protein
MIGQNCRADVYRMDDAAGVMPIARRGPISNIPTKKCLTGVPPIGPHKRHGAVK